MNFTDAQELAATKSGTNIIVSAGAGSGKTAVLTERAKRKVLKDTKVNELLVLTFTNAAAAEMKDRIREAIKSEPRLKEELDNIDSAYITTFDAFSLAIVKKYHTRLNISNNVGISDEIVIDLKKKEILNRLFDECYLSPKQDFLQLIRNFCLKEDDKLKNYILKVYKKIELKYNKTEYLNNYFNEFNDSKIDSFIDEYVGLIREKRDAIVNRIEDLYNYFEKDFVDEIKDSLTKFINAYTYKDFLNSMDYDVPSAPNGSDETGKKLKGEITKEIGKIRDNFLIYTDEEEIKNEINSTTSDIKVIIELLIKLDKEIEEYKYSNEIFNFNDIARMSILLLENNEDIREELKNSFKEIMIDEYQDTSDTQEKFISLISNDNVYMVGDIKQSIYRFRNANPNIFKDKYDKYSKNENGFKIDLLHNFRSRREVLQDIDTLFDYTMDLTIGGADYQKSHRMVFGNSSYEEEGVTGQDYHMNIITYNEEVLGKKLSKYEEEAFIIGNDILDKINSHYKIFDVKKKEVRECTYSDFVILLSAGTNFDLYKKIFEYLHIPLTVLKDEELNKDNDILIIKNLFKIIMHIKDNNFDNEFKYCFISLSRSFLYKISDEELYDIFVKDKYKETKLYNDCLLLSEDIDLINPKSFFRKVLEVTNYDQKLLTITNIKSNRVRCEYIYNLIESYEETGGTTRDFINYLDQIFEEDYDLKFKALGEISNSCIIQTIHGSKGLEYPICYFAGFTNEFNYKELNDRILYDNKYGIVLPSVNNYFKDTILKRLLTTKYKRENVGERIRLLYVALTRAKEKIIIVLPEQEENEEVNRVIPAYERETYKSFAGIIKSIYYNLNPYIIKSNIIGTRDYRYGVEKKKVDRVDTKLEVNELSIETHEIEEKHYSKEKLHLTTKEEKEVMEFGTKVHEYLEELDFSNPNLDLIKETSIRDKIKLFLESDLMKDRLNNKMYKEYEFIYEEDNTKSHGIIDLLVDDKDKYIIIDYKLKNIDDELYDKQLNGYRNYIEQRTNKKCLCYLYSIMDNVYREVK